MTPAPSAQASLFDPPTSAERLTPEIAPHPLVPEDDGVSRLKTVVSRVGRCSDPVDRIRSALELKAAVDSLVAHAVLEARSSGSSWRQLGADLGVPFQTLFRRYGAPPTETWED